MTIINPLPFNLQNGTTADATQVMADFNEILNDVNANGAHNGANSDITSLTGLSTPLSVAQGGTGTNLGPGTILLTSGTVAAATLDINISSYSAYRGFKILLSGFQPANNGVDLWVRLSKDAISYDGAAGNYAWFALSSSSNSDTKILMASTVSNDAAGGVNAWLEIFNVTVATLDPLVSFFGTNAAAAALPVWGSGARLAAQVTQGVRFLFSAGNIAAGNYAVYGYR